MHNSKFPDIFNNNVIQFLNCVISGVLWMIHSWFTQVPPQSMTFRSKPSSSQEASMRYNTFAKQLCLSLAGTFHYNTLKRSCWQVYISCSVILCAKDSLNSRCAQGCLGQAARRRRRDASQETARHYITQGPLRVARQTHNAGIWIWFNRIVNWNMINLF